MRIGANLPGPFWVSWNVGVRHRRGKPGGRAGCPSVLALPFLLPCLICVGIVKLYQHAWSRPATTGRKVASVTGVSLGLFVLLIIGLASTGSPQPPKPMSAAQPAPITTAASAPAPAPTPTPSPRAVPRTESPTPVMMDHSPDPAPSSYSPPAPVATREAPAPAHAAPSTQAPAAVQQPSPAGPACSPTTSSGHCYEPGEFCPERDHGLSGTAGDGASITCEDNHGWRWED